MIQKMYQVDAFTGEVFGGNPAAVLVLDAWMSDSLMQKIAAENNLSETAFLVANAVGWDLRWFTPTVEVDFCGHATLAAAHILVTEYQQPTPLRFSTAVGKLMVDKDRQCYLLDIPSLPPSFDFERHPSVERLFKTSETNHFKNFENYFVVLDDEEEVRNYQPDLRELEKLGSFGLVITARGNQYDFVSRYFAPGAGISEDPVTGSIHATLVPFWAKQLALTHLSAYQASARGGHLICKLENNRVIIQGEAATYMRGEINLPNSTL